MHPRCSASITETKPPAGPVTNTFVLYALNAEQAVLSDFTTLRNDVLKETHPKKQLPLKERPIKVSRKVIDGVGRRK
jgi:hypothetical protein